MGYNWEGDMILHDSAVDRKRYVLGRRQSITTDIREWISFEDNVIMKEILRTLRNEHGLPTSKKPGDFDIRAMVVWRFVAEKIRYVHDTTKYKKADFWLFPPETCQIGVGDCEDGSFLLASLLIAGGVSPFCVRVVLGRAFDASGKCLGGHCWPVYKNEAGRWCILESTLTSVPSYLPDADELTAMGQPFRYEPFYCFNGHHLWEIFSGENRAPKKNTLTKYYKVRRQKVDMRGIHQNDIFAQRRKGAKKV